MAHMWHGPFRVIEKCGEHAVRLEVQGTPYQLFPRVHVSKLKIVRISPDRPAAQLEVEETERVDFDEDLLPEDSWENDLAEGEYEVDSIRDVGTGRKTRYGRVHLQFLVRWKGHKDETWVDEENLNCGALSQEFERDRARRNRF
uniref:Chromo domain-containing protein n=1 Tax=Peronospora matthiolae TaxID=2874970 RepID=A0AAV1VER6_9STRA